MGARLDRILERLTGVPADKLRNTTIADCRIESESKGGASTIFYSAFPLIGRGNVMRKHFLSHTEVEMELEKALRK